jgi:hypothetical protein
MLLLPISYENQYIVNDEWRDWHLYNGYIGKFNHWKIMQSAVCYHEHEKYFHFNPHRPCEAHPRKHKGEAFVVTGKHYAYWLDDKMEHKSVQSNCNVDGTIHTYEQKPINQLVSRNKIVPTWNCVESRIYCTYVCVCLRAYLCVPVCAYICLFEGVCVCVYLCAHAQNTNTNTDTPKCAN